MRRGGRRGRGRGTALVVEVDVGSFLVFICCYLGFFMTLEPRHVLLVKAPRVLLELLGRQTLLVSALLEVEHEEEGVHRKAFEEKGIFGLRRVQRRVRKARMRVVVEVSRRISGERGELRSCPKEV